MKDSSVIEDVLATGGLVVVGCCGGGREAVVLAGDRKSGDCCFFDVLREWSAVGNTVQR